MTDAELLAAIDAAALPPAAFDHVAHLRLAWLHVDHPDALGTLARRIRGYAEAVGATGKYHHTLTAGWLALVADAAGRHPAPDSATWLARAPELLARDALAPYWSPERLAAGKDGPVAPDRAPLPFRLVPSDPRFAEAMARWREQPAHRRNNPIRPRTLGDLRADLAARTGGLAPLEPRPYRFFVTFGPLPVGQVSLRAVDLEHGHGEIGYGADEAWHGLGLGGAAVRRFVADLFARTPLVKLYAHVAVHNTPSIRVLERAGFVREGLLREHLVLEGRRVDHFVYGLIRPSNRTKSG